jgi:hypothetical protein
LAWFCRCATGPNRSSWALSSCWSLRHVGALSRRTTWPRTHTWALTDLTYGSPRRGTFGLGPTNELWFRCWSLRRPAVDGGFGLRTRRWRGRSSTAGISRSLDRRGPCGPHGNRSRSRRSRTLRRRRSRGSRGVNRGFWGRRRGSCRWFWPWRRRRSCRSALTVDRLLWCRLA